MIVNRSIQHITSKYGKRKGFKRFHKGIDLRTYTDNFYAKLSIVLPEDCIFIRKVYQKKWGWTYIFEPQESGYKELKFTHMGETDLIIDGYYTRGRQIGYTMVTPYMKKKKCGDHLHFETWGENEKGRTVHINPTLYMDIMQID